MTIYLAVILRPFLYLLFWGFAAFVAWKLSRFIPDGKIKDILYKKR